MNTDKMDLVNVDRRRTSRWDDKRDLGGERTIKRERKRERALANNGEKSITIHGRGSRNARLYCDLKLP